jgi:hypothetical protein
MHKEMNIFIDQAIYNSYMIIAGELTFEEILEHCRIKSEDNEDLIDPTSLPVFFIPPGEEYDNEDLDTMIKSFEETEEYEKCSVLLKLKK